MNKLLELFCDVDDFCPVFIPQWQQQLLADGKRKRQRAGHMIASEIMTIIITFHKSHHRDFKNFYTGHLQRFYRKEFPQILSYTRFLEMMPSVLVPLSIYFTQLKAEPTGIEFIDSTSIKVCHNLRIPRHKVFDRSAQRGKGTMGWFYGFKLHLIVNHIGGIVAAKLPPANVDDRKPVKELAKDRLYGDKGYISQTLTDDLAQEGVTLITGQHKNMKAKELSFFDRVMLSKRFIIETINDQLKNISQIEHS